MRCHLLAIIVICAISISGAAVAAECNQAGNLVANCDFDVDLSSWALRFGDSWSHVPADGATAPGCVEIDAENVSGTEYWVTVETPCRSFPAGISWDWGLSAKLISGGTTSQCGMWAQHFSDVSCTVSLTTTGTGPGAISPMTSTWQEGFAAGVGNSPATSQSVLFSVYCISYGEDFVVRIDDALFGQGLVPVELISFSVE